MKTSSTTMLCLLIVALGAICALSLSVGTHVLKNAAKIAAGRPYCLMVPGGEHGPLYRRVDSITDVMNMFVMHGDKGHNHAVLTVGYKETGQLWHWSYWSKQFETGAYGITTYSSCAPYKYDYEHLVAADYKDVIKKSFNGKTYVIPAPYHANRGGPTLILDVARKSFNPVRSCRNNDACMTIFVDAHRTHPMRLFSHSPIARDRFVSLRAYGLQTGAYISNKLHTDDLGPYFGTYYATNDEGRITTVIRCLAGSPYSCSMQFERGSLHYILRILPQDLPQWQALENKVVDFVASFQVSS